MEPTTQTPPTTAPAPSPLKTTDYGLQTPPKDTVKNAKKVLPISTQAHLPIAEIRDNVLVLKNGGIRTVLRSSSMNLHLKSEDEQTAVIYSYQNFLNSLEFPIQIVVRSQKLDLDNYLDTLKGIAKKQVNSLLKEQTVDYIDYIQRLIEYADIMQKEFYVVVPYDPPRAKKPTLVQKFMGFMKTRDTLAELQQRHREFETLRKGLNQRVNVVSSGLSNCGLKVEPLKTDELITLFYESFNPRTARIQKIKKSEDVAVEKDTDLHDGKKQEKEGSE